MESREEDESGWRNGESQETNGEKKRKKMEGHFAQCTDVPSPPHTQGHEHRVLGDSFHSFTQSHINKTHQTKIPHGNLSSPETENITHCRLESPSSGGGW